MSQDFRYFESTATNAERLERAIASLENSSDEASLIEKMTMVKDAFDALKAYTNARLHQAAKSGNNLEQEAILSETVLISRVVLGFGRTRRTERNLPDPLELARQIAACKKRRESS